MKGILMDNQPAQQPSIVDLKQYIEANMLDGDKIQDGQMISSQEVYDVMQDYMVEVYAAFRSLAVAAAPEKLYSGKHNASHTWITNNYCHACHEYLSNVQQQEEFGHNSAIEQYQANILAGLENKS